MTNIAFIGLGTMGSPMAGHLVEAGHRVHGYNRSPERTHQLAEAGGIAGTSVAEVVQDADVVAVMVPVSSDVQDVLLGDSGAFAHARTGSLVVDFSSIRPDVSVDLAKEARGRGLRMLDAPVSGGEAGAIAGTLSIMVGGEQADFEDALPLLNVVGRTVVHVGPSGAGQTVKAANQLMVAANIQALAEAIVFLEAFGVDVDRALEVLGGGLAGSAVLQQKGAKMRDRSFEPGFRVELHHKDLGIVRSSAREVGVVTPVAALLEQLMAACRASGDGQLDHSAMIRLVDQLSGRGEDHEPSSRHG